MSEVMATAEISLDSIEFNFNQDSAGGTEK